MGLRILRPLHFLGGLGRLLGTINLRTFIYNFLSEYLKLVIERRASLPQKGRPKDRAVQFTLQRRGRLFDV